jgi:hypothetical protein
MDFRGRHGCVPIWVDDRKRVMAEIAARKKAYRELFQKSIERLIEHRKMEREMERLHDEIDELYLKLEDIEREKGV